MRGPRTRVGAFCPAARRPCAMIKTTSSVPESADPELGRAAPPAPARHSDEHGAWRFLCERVVLAWPNIGEMLMRHRRASGAARVTGHHPVPVAGPLGEASKW